MAFEFAYCEEPLFWTHNSEYKPSHEIVGNLNFTVINKCPISFIDNFTIKTILPKNINATILRVTDIDRPNVSPTQITKYYLLNKTSKIMQGGYEYEGTLDAWMTYALPFIFQLRLKGNKGKYPVKVNRFLNNRIFRRYVLQHAYTQPDEYFNYTNEEYGFVGQNIFSTTTRAKKTIGKTKSNIGFETDGETIANLLAQTVNEYKIVDGGSNFQIAITPIGQKGGFDTTPANLLAKLVVYQLGEDLAGLWLKGDYVGFLTFNQDVRIRIVAHNKMTNNEFRYSVTEGDIIFKNSYWSGKLKGVFYTYNWKFLLDNMTLIGSKAATSGDTKTMIMVQFKAEDFNKYISPHLGDSKSVSFSPTRLFRYSPTHRQSSDRYGAGGFIDESFAISNQIDYGNYARGIRETINGINGVYRYVIASPFNNVRAQKVMKEMLTISKYPKVSNIPNAYVFSRAKISNSYLSPTYLLEQTSTPLLFYRNIGVGEGGFFTFNGLNFTTYSPWLNKGGAYINEGLGTSNTTITSFDTWLNTSKQQMNTQLTIAKQRSELATADAVIGGLSGIAKSGGKAFANFVSGNIGGGLANTLSAGTSLGSMVTGLVRAEQIYSHAKLSQEALMVDKRNSSTAELIRSNYADDDIKNKMLFDMASSNLGDNVPSFSDLNPASINNWILIDDRNRVNFTTYDLDITNVPLGFESSTFYNRLSWEVGMKADFYMDAHIIFSDDYSSENTTWFDKPFYITDGTVSGYQPVNNPFSYLVLDIEEYIYRALFPYATLEEIGAIQGMFSSGVRIWKRRPTNNTNDDFIILDVSKKYRWYTEPDDMPEELKAIELPQELTNAKTKKRSKRK